MKTVFSRTFLSLSPLFTFLAFLLQSCEVDSNIPDGQLPVTEAHREVSAENSANDYDATGKLMYDICHDYLDQNLNLSVTDSIVDVVESLADLNPVFLTLRPSHYISPSSSRIDFIVGTSTPLGIITGSGLSLNAKQSLTDFLTDLMDLRDLDADYDEVYDFIVDYESTIMSNTAFSTQDRKIMLVGTSISRYGFYFAKKHRRKPRDRDWDISWGHIVAGIDGSEDNLAKAIIMASAVNLISNN